MSKSALTMAAVATLPISSVSASENAANNNQIQFGNGAHGQSRKLGSLNVSPIGLGCMSMAPGFYNPAPAPKDMIDVIRRSYDLGVTFFDTAEIYGPFISEQIVGEALKPIRDHVVIASKFGFAFTSSGGYAGRNSRPEHIKTAVEGMLKRLNTDHIDLLYLHRMDPNVPIEDIAGAVGDLIKEGKAIEFGLSEINPETLKAAHAVTPVAAVQSEYSVFERLPEIAMLETCEKLGVGFVPWGPTARALVTDRFNEYSRFASGDRRANVPFFREDALQTNMEVVRLVRKWADNKGATPVQFALAWLLAQKPFIVPIPGSTILHHVRENFDAIQLEITPEELERFRVELEGLPIAGNRPSSAAFENQ
ncbi:aldo/keto reductase [Vibrio natriegens]|uniref:aldo/keto reductase n=1 Tax=Vibrio natriegens TaxID=691 RepID=UPI0018C8A2A8|nr:aldo/keto reductase [Vibrio natriegens]